LVFHRGLITWVFCWLCHCRLHLVRPMSWAQSHSRIPLSLQCFGSRSLQAFEAAPFPAKVTIASGPAFLICTPLNLRYRVLCSRLLRLLFVFFFFLFYLDMTVLCRSTQPWTTTAPESAGRRSLTLTCMKIYTWVIWGSCHTLRKEAQPSTTAWWLNCIPKPRKFITSFNWYTYLMFCTQCCGCHAAHSFCRQWGHCSTRSRWHGWVIKFVK
jgi:hypothetical protein